MSNEPNAVSTHSRPKAAGRHVVTIDRVLEVSTHSRPKAAGRCGCARRTRHHRFNSQPPEGGWFQLHCKLFQPRGFNSQPPEGGWSALLQLSCAKRCFNSQPPEGGWLQLRACHTPRVMFQLTAARRRLGDVGPANSVCGQVSTHSRPKAAG